MSVVCFRSGASNVCIMCSVRLTAGLTAGCCTFICQARPDHWLCCYTMTMRVHLSHPTRLLRCLDPVWASDRSTQGPANTGSTSTSDNHHAIIALQGLCWLRSEAGVCCPAAVSAPAQVFTHNPGQLQRSAVTLDCVQSLLPPAAGPIAAIPWLEDTAELLSLAHMLLW